MADLTDEQLAEWERDAEELVSVARNGRVDNLIAAVLQLIPALRDARAENAELRKALGLAASRLKWLPSRYTVAEENALRVVSLLHSECYGLGDELAALAAPTGQEKE